MFLKRGEWREPVEASRAALADAVLAMPHSSSLELARNAKSLVLHQDPSSNLHLNKIPGNSFVNGRVLGQSMWWFVHGTRNYVLP